MALPPAAPVPEPAPEPAIDWAALASAARPVPRVIREAEIAALEMPEPAPGAPAAPDFSLLDSIGLMPEPAPAPPPPVPGGTLARLRSQIAGSAEQPLPSPAYQTGPAGLSSTPPTGTSAGEGIVPASAVTVSLGEVMRLIASGSPPAASPIDTFRAALRSSSPF
ncbi:hypothetical protein EJV46_20030 [Roseococcus sp. SYP-B2431]|nr:hypothetical protein EJV46_20030 [Roseococcus sp. SYP-B2431]